MRSSSGLLLLYMMATDIRRQDTNIRNCLIFRNLRQFERESGEKWIMRSNS